GVVGEVRPLSPDEHLLAGPDGAETHEAGGLRRRGELAPRVGTRVVRGRDVHGTRRVRLAAGVEGRLLVTAEDEHLLAGPDAGAGVELGRDRRGRERLPAGRGDE